jgi:hypothetical protein
MSDLLSKVVPLALGSAVSPTILALSLLILSGKNHPKLRCTAYAGGAALALIIAALLALLVFDRTVASDSGGSHSSSSAIIDIAIGAFLLALSALLARRPPSRPKAAKEESRSPMLGRYFGIGFGGMMVNFTTLALFFDETKEIARADVSSAGKTAVLALVIFMPLVPVLAPLAIYSVAPTRADSILAPVNSFVKRHARTIGLAITFVFGVYLIVKGSLAL